MLFLSSLDNLLSDYMRCMSPSSTTPCAFDQGWLHFVYFFDYLVCFDHFQISTETAPLRVCNDILRSLDKPHGEVILVLLDLTAAFDTIDHALLLQRLRQRYRIGGKVFQWFESYLHQHEQSVLINTSKSDPLTMEWGIPQGSIGGPILFVSYTAHIIYAHSLSFVIYADDTQFIFPWNFISTKICYNWENWTMYVYLISKLDDDQKLSCSQR